MLETIYWTAPAWLSNSFAAIFCYFFVVKNPLLPNWPVDFYGTIFGKRIFGENKTLVGSAVTILFGIFVGWVQGNAIGGLWFGFAVFSGGILNSFIKRRLGIHDGGNLWVFDQIDYALLVIAVAIFFPFTLPNFDFIYFLVFVFIYQFVINYVASLMCFRKRLFLSKP